MAEIVGFVLKYSKSLKKTATSQFLLINSHFFFVDLKILGGIILQVTSLQGRMLVKKGQATPYVYAALNYTALNCTVNSALHCTTLHYKELNCIITASTSYIKCSSGP